MTGAAEGHRKQSYSAILASLAERTQRLVEARLAADNLRIEDWRVVDYLADHRPCTMSELAGGAVLTGPTLTRTVDRLVSRGIAHRVAAPEDRRKVLVNLSSRGIELHEQLSPGVSIAELQALRSEQSDLDLRQLVALLAR